MINKSEFLKITKVIHRKAGKRKQKLKKERTNKKLKIHGRLEAQY